MRKFAVIAIVTIAALYVPARAADQLVHDAIARQLLNPPDIAFDSTLSLALPDGASIASAPGNGSQSGGSIQWNRNRSLPARAPAST